MKRLIALTLVLFASTVGSARAVALINPDGSVAQPYQAWADAATVPTPDASFTIQTDMSLCGDLSDPVEACTHRSDIVLRQRCEIYRSLRLRRNCRFVFWHELGHQESWAMPQWKRDAYSKLMEMTWADPSILTAEPQLDESFADAYALCQMNRTSIYARWTTAGTMGQTLAACRLIRRPY